MWDFSAFRGDRRLGHSISLTLAISPVTLIQSNQYAEAPYCGVTCPWPPARELQAFMCDQNHRMPERILYDLLSGSHPNLTSLTPHLVLKLQTQGCFQLPETNTFCLDFAPALSSDVNAPTLSSLLRLSLHGSAQGSAVLLQPSQAVLGSNPLHICAWITFMVNCISPEGRARVIYLCAC